MKVKNVSARLHHVGNVSIAPGEEKEIPDAYKGSTNKVDLVEVKAPVPGTKAPVASAPKAV